VNHAVLNSVEYGSRTRRKRYFMFASMYEGFQFPEPTGVNPTPIAEDEEITLENLEWVTPEDSKTLSYFLERQKKKMTHNHVMTFFDIMKDAYVGTITKSHHKIHPENWIKHPYLDNHYAYLKAEHVRSLQSVPKTLTLGESNKLQIESMGQSVCYKLFCEPLGIEIPSF
jgi:DNA (cytosine-5)-methyltransferase 1